MKFILLTAAIISSVLAVNFDNYKNNYTKSENSIFGGDSLKNKDKSNKLKPDSSLIDQLEKLGGKTPNITVQQRNNINYNMPEYVPNSSIRYNMPIVTPNSKGYIIKVPNDSFPGFRLHEGDKSKLDSLLKKNMNKK